MRLLDGDLDRGFEPHILSGQCLLDEPWSRQRGCHNEVDLSAEAVVEVAHERRAAAKRPLADRESLGSRAIETGERLREQELPAIQIPPLARCCARPSWP